MKRGVVVLIDDNKVELELFKIAFHETHFPRDLVTFSDPREAWKYLTHHMKEVFIVLCDINMPVMTGPELLEKINQNHELKMLTTPFIFLSNSDIAKDIDHAYTLAAQGYFQKPMDTEHMTKLLNLIIDYWTAARIPRDKHHYIH